MFKWQSSNASFVQIQLLPTTQGSDICAFQIGSNNYLAVASLSSVADIFIWDAVTGTCTVVHVICSDVRCAEQYSLNQVVPSAYEDFSVSYLNVSDTAFLAVATIGSLPSFQARISVVTYDEI